MVILFLAGVVLLFTFGWKIFCPLDKWSKEAKDYLMCRAAKQEEAAKAGTGTASMGSRRSMASLAAASRSRHSDADSEIRQATYREAEESVDHQAHRLSVMSRGGRESVCPSAISVNEVVEAVERRYSASLTKRERDSIIRNELKMRDR